MGSSSTQLPFLLAIVISASAYATYVDEGLFEQEKRVTSPAAHTAPTVQKSV